MKIYKYPIENFNEPISLPIEIVGFEHDGHGKLCAWAIDTDLRVEYMVVGTGHEFNSTWIPMGKMAVSKGGFVWHLLKRR